MWIQHTTHIAPPSAGEEGRGEREGSKKSSSKEEEEEEANEKSHGVKFTKLYKKPSVIFQIL